MKNFLNILLTKLGYVKLEQYQKLLNRNTELYKLSKYKQEEISALSKELKNYEKILKKSSKDKKRVLTKYINTREQVKILSQKLIEADSELTKVNTRVKYLTAFNEALLCKLEYLCFGSVLPRVMKQTNLSIYLYPIKTIKKQFIETKDGLKLRATEYESND